MIVAGSRRAKDASPEEREAGAAEHAALDPFQPVHLPLDVTVAPMEAERGEHGVVVASQPAGEDAELRLVGRG